MHSIVALFPSRAFHAFGGNFVPTASPRISPPSEPIGIGSIFSQDWRPWCTFSNRRLFRLLRHQVGLFHGRPVRWCWMAPWTNRTSSGCVGCADLAPHPSPTSTVERCQRSMPPRLPSPAEDTGRPRSTTDPFSRFLLGSWPFAPICSSPPATSVEDPTSAWYDSSSVDGPSWTSRVVG